MSFQALGWAVDQRPERPVDKLILYGLADRHNTEDGVAFPSLAWLIEFSGLDRKTIIAGLDRLEAAGFVSDSGKRYGKTGQVKGYRLHLERRRETAGNGKSTENGTVPKTDGKQSRKRNPEPVREPRDKPSAYPPPSPSFAKPEGVEDQTWADFLTNRKGGNGRRACPNTPTAHKKLMDDLKRISAKTGLTFEQLVAHAAAKGWQGIYAPREDEHGPGVGGNGRANGNGAGTSLFRVGLEREAARRASGSGNSAGWSGDGGGDTGLRFASDW